MILVAIEALDVYLCGSPLRPSQNQHLHRHCLRSRFRAFCAYSAGGDRCGFGETLMELGPLISWHWSCARPTAWTIITTTFTSRHTRNSHPLRSDQRKVENDNLPLTKPRDLARRHEPPTTSLGPCMYLKTPMATTTVLMHSSPETMFMALTIPHTSRLLARISIHRALS
jgi:hypothetical protein